MTTHRRTETVVAEILHNAGIPCVLTGPGLHALYGVENRGLGLAMRTIDFVVPDAQVTKAASALLEAQSSWSAFSVCPEPDPSSCEAIKWQVHRRLQPSVHLHAEAEFSDRVIEIFSQSAVMWMLPEMDQALLPRTPLNPEGFSSSLPSSFMLATDPSLPKLDKETRIPCGSFAADEYPVVIPKSHVLMDMLFHQYARHLDETFWDEPTRAIICLSALWQEGIVELDPTLLPAPLRKYFPDKNNTHFWRRDWSREEMVELGYLDAASRPDGPA